MKVLLPNFGTRLMTSSHWDGKKFKSLVTVITQDFISLEVLMVAYTDEEGYIETLKTGLAVYYSTSRSQRWMKGETSGDTQEVQKILLDCDGDAVIYLVKQNGEGACHTGAKSCFYRNCYREITKVPNAGVKDRLNMIEVYDVNPRFIS